MNYSVKEYKSVVTGIGISLLLFLLLFNVLYGGVSALAEMLVTGFYNSTLVVIISEILCSIAYLLSFVLPVPFFYAISKNATYHPMDLTLKIPSNRPALTYTAIIFAGLAVIIPMATVNALIFPVTTEASDVMDYGVFKTSESYRLVLDLIATAIVPAFAEEFLFRGLIVSNLKPYSKSAAVVVSAVAFGLMHQNPMQLFYATTAGLVLGLVYVASESIWCCIALHFVNNFISIIQNYLISVFGYDTALLLVIFFDVFIVIIGVVGGLYLLSALKRNKETRREPRLGVFGLYCNLDRGAERKCQNNLITKAFLTPSFAVFVAVCIVISLVTAIMFKAF